MTIATYGKDIAIFTLIGYAAGTRGAWWAAAIVASAGAIIWLYNRTADEAVEKQP